jgi:hypothetical protein
VVNQPVEIGLAIVVAIVCFALNKQFAQACSDFQKSMFAIDYPLRDYTIPIYFVGMLFIAIIIARLFDK